MLRHRKKHSNALNHMNSFQHLKSENGENNGSSINNSASDMSDDESSTLAMINNKKLMEMSQQDAKQPSQEMINHMMSGLSRELMMKFLQPQGGSNLLENLLGISGQSINHLMSSPDEAAKLLRVDK